MDVNPHVELALPLHAIALATCAPAGDDASSPEAEWLCAQREALQAIAPDLATHVQRWRASPPPHDARLCAFADAWQLSIAEIIAVSLACAAETDSMVGRVLAWLQAPIGGARPTAGLVALLASHLGDAAALATLAGGRAHASGLLHIAGDARTLPEASVTVPLPIVFALGESAHEIAPPGITIGLADAPPLPASIKDAAQRRAAALAADGALVVRSGHPREARAVAAAIAAALQARAAFFESDPPPGFAPWLALSQCVPVYCAELAPGERRQLPELPGWRGRWLVASGPDGGFERAREALSSWRVPVPAATERIALWHASTGVADLAQTLGTWHRHPAGRIAELARAGEFQRRLSGAGTLTTNDIAIAARSGASGDLGTLAELMPEAIADDALVLPATTRRELEALARRCVTRDALADALGPATRARYRTGVRALLVGPSGTGKTLAAGWLATRLGLPLYRVDLASITSKYIGETEKNLAQLFARAEHAEVLLLFDEADSLFGKRTDVKEANDRFANAQTNYLLSRIETYEGLAILTSNSRARFDSAFTRRLDAIIEFAAPGPSERRALWLAHLGQAHALTPGELNRLAATCELAGGHVRNIVLAAAVAPRAEGRPIGADDLAVAAVAEYRKLGKPAPAALQPGTGS
ncbi:MAG TPA: ATP-binding protein [Burkholderiales bacterium]|nr:ATP-binding protein [Burkholderiales bacterium]